MSFRELTKDEETYINDLSAVGRSLWQASARIQALSGDPKMNSIILYNRLWSNYWGFIILWNAKFQLEADIILRSAIETAICIVANSVLKDEFSKLIRGDLVATLKNQIKRFRDDGDLELVQKAEAELRKQINVAPERPKTFDWKELATIGGQPLLYATHKTLSMQSSHVTGLSLTRGVVGADGDGTAEQNEMLAIGRKMHLMALAGAMTQSVLVHAGIIGADELVVQAAALAARLDEISFDWGPEE
jgi:hypothetical protein